MSAFVKVSENHQFHLGNERISYIIEVSPEGIVEHKYFGRAVSRTEQLPRSVKRLHRSCSLHFQDVPYYNLNDVAQEYPLFGTSDHRQPALHIVNGDGNSTQVFLYDSYQVLDSKPALEGLPSARGDDSQTLILTLKDQLTGLTLELSYTIYAEHDVVSRSAKLINNGERTVSIEQIASTCLDLSAEDYDLLHLKGTWARELNEDRIALPQGRFTIDSATGASGNVHNPFLAIMDRTTNEHQGRVVGLALMYSGNFAISTEMGEFDSVRILAGINPFNFAWRLEAGESFTTPEAIQVFSDHGLNGMSQVWHGFVKQKISPPQFADQSRPTYLNSWEAAYFDIDEAKVLELADRTKELGLEMLVVDDGWFEGRDSDTTSGGDWFSDKRKFPNGIEHVAAQVQAKGLKFGLWFEPEMMSPVSQLFEAHPDWIIHVPNRINTTGRHQLTLDLSRRDVQDYLFERIDFFLGSGHIDYVKWDMNRNMSDIGSAGLSPDRQLETAHRYMLGVYALVGKLVEKYPNVLFENCASGGNRFDLGMLRYMSQSWVSDMSEPIGRLPIINGASYLFPPSVTASYICPVPSHLNGRQVSMKTRAEVGFFCAARGLSLNAEDVDADKEELKEIAAMYQATAEDVVNGRFYRVKNVEQEVCWQLNSNDGSTVYLGYFHILSGANLPFRHIRMLALEPQAHYRLQGSDLVYSGDALMNMGLDMPYVSAIQTTDDDFLEAGDFSSRLFVFERV